MLGNFGTLSLKCMQQVTKDHLSNLLEVSDYYVMYRQFCETSAEVTNWLLILLDGSVNFCENFVVRGREF